MGPLDDAALLAKYIYESECLSYMEWLRDERGIHLDDDSLIAYALLDMSGDHVFPSAARVHLEAANG